MPSDSSNLNEEIVAALDVLAEYQAIGFKPVGSPKSDGWQDGHALGREDRNASAGINLQTGIYKDHGSDGLALPMFKAIAQFTGDTWHDVRARLAKKVGLSRRLPKKKYGQMDKDYDPEGQLVIFVNQRIPEIFCKGLLARYGFSFQALLDNGAIFGQYPSWSIEHMQRIVAIPIFAPTPNPLKHPPRGYVLMRCDGKDIVVPQKNAAPRIEKRISIGRSGLVGKAGLKVFQETPHHIEDLRKVEGVTDLLTLYDKTPESCRFNFPVITNSSGAGEKLILGDVAAMISNCDQPINLSVIHDADEPGQTGAKRWAADVGPVCRWFRNVQLPYQIEEKHGKDLRNYFEDGNDFKAFQAMVKNHNPLDVKSDAGKAANTMSEDEENLAKLNAIVLGYRSKKRDRLEIVLYSRNLAKEVIISSSEKALRNRLVGEFGGHIRALEANGQFNVKRVMDSILALATRPADDENRVGQGTWEIDGQLHLIGTQGGFRYKGDGTFEKLDTPILPDGLFASYGSRPWFDPDILFPYVEKATDTTWAKEQFDMISEKLFGQWTNLTHSWDSKLLTAVACACWMQPNWDLRPQVFISGPSNTGKTIMLNRAFPGLFGRLAFPTGDTTASGITQHVGSDSRIMLLDEFERSKNRVEIIKMFRNVTRGSIIARGTASHSGYSAQLKIIPIMAAIERGKTVSAADINRSVWIDLQEVPPERRGKLILPPVAVLRDYGYRLHAIAIAHWPRMREIELSLKNCSFDEVESRLIECYGVLCAVMGGLGGLSDSEAAELLRTVLAQRVELQEQRQVDHEELLYAILALPVKNRKFDCTVGQLMQVARSEKTPSFDQAFGANPDEPVDLNSARAVLEQYGIKYTRGDARTGGYAAWNFQPDMISQRLDTVRSGFGGIDVRGQLLRLIPQKSRSTGRARIPINGTRLRQVVRIPLFVMDNFLSSGERELPEFEEGVFDSFGE